MHRAARPTCFNCAWSITRLGRCMAMIPIVITCAYMCHLAVDCSGEMASIRACRSVGALIRNVRQRASTPELDLTILPTPGDCSALRISDFHFDGIMGEDMSFAPPHLQFALHSRSPGCYPQPGV